MCIMFKLQQQDHVRKSEQKKTDNTHKVKGVTSGTAPPWKLGNTNPEFRQGEILHTGVAAPFQDLLTRFQVATSANLHTCTCTLQRVKSAKDPVHAANLLILPPDLGFFCLAKEPLLSPRRVRQTCFAQTYKGAQHLDAHNRCTQWLTNAKKKQTNKKQTQTQNTHAHTHTHTQTHVPLLIIFRKDFFIFWKALRSPSTASSTSLRLGALCLLLLSP